jgi:hypothetical protein
LPFNEQYFSYTCIKARTNLDERHQIQYYIIGNFSQVWLSFVDPLIFLLLYLINHIRPEAITIERMIPSGIIILQSDGMSTLIVDVLHGFQLNYVMILYIRTVLSFARLCSRGSHFKGRTLFGGPKVKVEFRHLFSLQKRFSLCSSHKINANIDVVC